MSQEPAAASDQWTVDRLLKWTTEYLDRNGLDEPRLSAELLLSHALGCAKIDLYARHDRVADDEQRSRLRALVRRAADHEPIAYLVGRKEFYSLSFEVTPDVLIPRPETEMIVERMIGLCRSLETGQVTFLDVGTGSGCIAIAVLSQVKAARAVGSDVSSAALAVAGRNAEAHGVLDRLTLVEADRLDLPADCVPAGGFDVIVSNPPYVAEGDLTSLAENVRKYEPHTALFAGPDGLAFYRSLHDSAAGLLKSGGSVLVEIGAGIGDAVRRVMEDGERFEHAGTWHDAADPHDRVMQFILRSGSGPAAGGPTGA
ncbi:MAG TPA: peptide chain release factor N(5)-glutamine methyltransferase [Phycisphaerae bacterium]|nr:peptide chain release factor N(5)-glutamine methyltransferase [Phycisphaerae bacterium]